FRPVPIADSRQPIAESVAAHKPRSLAIFAMISSPCELLRTVPNGTVRQAVGKRSRSSTLGSRAPSNESPDRRRRKPRQRIQSRGKAGRMDAVGREIRHAARRLVRSPAFTLATVLTLTLAIGANAAIFTVVYRVVLNPLPYPDSDRLIALDYGFPARNINSGINYMSWQLYYELADRARTLESVAVYNFSGVT